MSGVLTLTGRDIIYLLPWLYEKICSCVQKLTSIYLRVGVIFNFLLFYTTYNRFSLMLLRIDTVFKVRPCFKHNSFVCKNQSIEFLEMTILGNWATDITQYQYFKLDEVFSMFR